MDRFIEKFGRAVTGILSGFDRLVFRGTVRSLSHVNGVVGLLLRLGVQFVDFGSFVERQTKTLTRASLAAAEAQGRPVRYLQSSRWSKEEIARGIAEADKVRDGLVCVLKCVEPCYSFELVRNRERKKARIEARKRKCLFLYHYFVDPQFGLMSARIQTWLPYSIQVCLNGREWAARQMDQAGIEYRRADNTFSWVSDVAGAQRLFDTQLNSDWPSALERIARQLNPAHEAMLGSFNRYYWSTYQSEWATDVMFASPQRLETLYRKLTREAILAFGAEEVMRYLRAIEIRPDFQGRIVSDLRRREEGARVRHWIGENSIKMYDKTGGVLRVETTINDPSHFKSYRPKEGDPGGTKQWLPMRRGVADLHRRAEVSQAANERYLDALASLDVDQTVAQWAEHLCRPTRWKGQRIRALRPWSPEDHALLAAVARGEGVLNGLRNRDLRARLYPQAPKSDPAPARRITRQLRLLRAHGLIRKIPKTHRYILTEKGRQITSAILQTLSVPVQELTKRAA